VTNLSQRNADLLTLSAALFDNPDMGRAYLAGVLADDATAIDWIENAPGVQLIYASDANDTATIKTAKTAMKSMLDAAGLGAAGLLLRLNNAFGTSFTDLGSLFGDASAASAVVSDAALFALVAASAANRAYLLYDAPWAAALGDTAALTRYLNDTNMAAGIVADAGLMGELWDVALETTSIMTLCLSTSAIVNAIFAAPAKIGALLATREYRAMIEASSLAVAKMNAYGTAVTGTITSYSTVTTLYNGLVWVASARAVTKSSSSDNTTSLTTTFLEYSGNTRVVLASVINPNWNTETSSVSAHVNKFASKVAAMNENTSGVQSNSSTITYRTW
jgi:hypothetical protein